jgi:hypothetical protein
VEKMKIIALLVVAVVLVCFSAVEEVEGQQFSHPSFMLLWRSTVGSTGKRVVDLRHLMEPLFNPSANTADDGRVAQERAIDVLFDFVDPDDALEQIRGVGPLGFIEVQSASSSFNRPLFDYDRLVQNAYQTAYHNLSPLL